MDQSDPFSEESFRYAAECRRLARLARKPIKPDNMGTVAYLRLLDWMTQLRSRYISPADRPQFFGGRDRFAHH